MQQKLRVLTCACVFSPSALKEDIRSVPRSVLPNAALAVGAVPCRVHACKQTFKPTFLRTTGTPQEANLQDAGAAHIAAGRNRTNLFN